MKTILTTILNTGNYKYCYENGKFTFYDNRIGDITKGNYNSSLFSAIRQEHIVILDLSMCPNVPDVISGFPYVTEIIMPTLTDNIPSIANCPKLEKVTFDPSTIIILKEKSFDGWPPIKQISFGEDFEYMFYFDFECDIKETSVKNLLAGLDNSTEQFTFLGAYSEKI